VCRVTEPGPSVTGPPPSAKVAGKMISSHTRVVLGCAMGLVLAGAGARVARAAEADDLIREGVELRRKDEQAPALKRFERAYELSKAPHALAQMGLAKQALGMWGTADRNLRESMQATDDPWIQKNRSTLEKALETIAGHVGTLEVTGAPAGAEALVDGERVGLLPTKVSVTTGTAVLEVRASGYLPVQRTTTIATGELTRERFNLQRSTPKGAMEARDATGATGVTGVTDKEPGAPPGEGPSSAGAIGAPRDASSTPSGEGPPVPPSTGGWRGPTMVATGIGAVAALGFGITEAVLAGGKVDSFNGMAACNRYASDRGGPGCASLYDDGQQSRLLSYVGFGVAGALAVTSVVLFLTRPEPTAKRSAMAACTARVGGIGVSCAVAF
jgi:hypothetical protein